VYAVRKAAELIERSRLDRAKVCRTEKTQDGGYGDDDNDDDDDNDEYDREQSRTY
jgi:phosphopantothenoylcysteine synthetase/decarboxylase